MTAFIKTEPGVYDVDISDYHGREICPTPSISGSGLVQIAPPYGVPAKFWWDSSMNPQRDPVDSAALRVGKCLHTLFLEGMEAVQKQFVIDDLPRTGTGSKTALEAFKAKAEADGKIIIRLNSTATERGWKDILGMARAIERYPLFKAAFTDGAAEKTILCQDPETGVWMRARPDWLPNNVVHFPEFKTGRDASQIGFSNAIKSYGYHIKAAHLMECCRLVGLGDPRTYTHYVLETSPPYLAAIHTLPRETLEYGEVQRRSALRIFARCLERDEWPGYPEAPQETGLPVYALKSLQNADLSETHQQETTDEPRTSNYGPEDYLRAG